MGMCYPCPTEAEPPSPDLEEKRAKLAEAAERRQKEAASRGILNVQSVEEKRKKKEKMEKQIATSGPPPEGGLRFNLFIFTDKNYATPLEEKVPLVSFRFE
ncbi:Small VCP/p97-interacting protein [Camelus dromedarius]|uniref:Small VCP/p97-interacting protein n=1 Tax=Camelus dromedarius TaxID=9838 RepID=A0A5N4DPJ6_CAMDR|nr:Small VCP/p97-interacting protein [Camelus dromedarius]